MRRHLAIAAFAALSPLAAIADEARLPVEDFRILLVRAIDSPDGSAKGILIGTMTEALTKRLQATGPVLIDVTTLRRYRQDGCSRMNVRFSQEGVHQAQGKAPRTQTLDMGLNYCRDGQPPKSLL